MTSQLIYVVCPDIPSMTTPNLKHNITKLMVGPWPLASHQDYLQYMYHVFLMQVALKPGYYTSSPLQLGVSDPKQILKTSRKIKRSQSSPALCNPDQLDLSSPFSVLKEEEQDSSWLKPTIPVSNFQIFTDPQSFKKEKTLSP